MTAFADLTSACTSGLGAADRTDPYWAGIWEQGASATWLSANLARRQADAGLGRIPTWLDNEPGALTESIRSPRRESRLAAMSVLDTWRTVTGEQLAAITGDPDLGSARARAMGELFAAGIADIGQFNTGLAYGGSAGHIYRPSRTNVFDHDIAPRLTYPEWVSVTAGHPWESGSQYDRHNVIAAELALRVAEFCEIGAVVGEKLSTWNLLAHEGAGFPAPQKTKQRAADATLIRTDGARIAVELTASTGANFSKKVNGWAQLLSNRRMADTGLVVVFVVATRPDKMVNTGEVLSQVRTAIASAARDNPGVNFDRTAARMFVADWRDWFPAAGEAAPGFLTLQAERPTGAGSARWETASLLDPFDVVFEPTDPARAAAAVNNLAGIRSVPHWLRTGKRPTLWPHPIKQLGFDGIPVPTPSKPESHIGVPLGAGKGVTGATKPPARLVA